MIGSKKLRGSLRLAAAVILSVVLLPYILRFYLALAPDSTAHEIWMALVQAVPFGDWLATVVISLWSEAQSGIDSLMNWLTSQQLQFPLHLSVEISKLIFTSVLLMVVSAFVGGTVLKDSGGGFLNHAADAGFQVLCCFAASLVANLVFRFFETELIQSNEIIRQVAAGLFTLVAGGGGLWMLVAAGLLFFNAILVIAAGCLKLLVSYGIFMWLLVNEMLGGPSWLMPVGAVGLLLFLWLIQRFEKLFVP